MSPTGFAYAPSFKQKAIAITLSQNQSDRPLISQLDITTIAVVCQRAKTTERSPQLNQQRARCLRRASPTHLRQNKKGDRLSLGGNQSDRSFYVYTIASNVEGTIP
jgi:hypothetical protein